MSILAMLFQSTLPRGERQAGKEAYAYAHDVSIHAPAWGATRSFVNDTLKLSHLPRSMFKKRGVKVSHC